MDRHEKNQNGVTAVIPAYNEEKGIGRVLADLKKVLEGLGLPYEILVVDDGSSDQTAEVVQKSSARLLQGKENQGYGASVKTGIRNAQYELICITDGDGTYPHNVIPELVKLVSEQFRDMAVAARTGRHVAIPLIRRPAKWVISRLANMVVGRRIPDINSGLRVFRRSTVLEFFNLLPDGFSFTTTITLAMMTNNHLVDYIPIDYFARVGTSKIRPVRDTLGFIQLILRIALYFAPLKIFLPLSALLALLAVVWGLFSLLVLGRLADVTTVVISMTAIQVAVLGLLAELFNRRLPNHYQGEQMRRRALGQVRTTRGSSDEDTPY